MNRKKLLERYNQSYTEEKFYKENLACAFSEEQLQEAMKKLGAKDKSELTSLFGAGDICLKSKAKEIYLWILDKEVQKKKWLKSLSPEEQNFIIKYELYNHECRLFLGYRTSCRPIQRCIYLQ